MDNILDDIYSNLQKNTYNKTDKNILPENNELSLFIEDNINPANFLKQIYNIHSTYEAITYINKNKPNKYTSNRIINATWRAYIYDTDNIPDIFYEYYITKIKVDWRNKITNYLISKSYNIAQINKKFDNFDKIKLKYLFNNICLIHDSNVNYNKLILQNFIEIALLD